ncbi:zinc finger protein 512B isoform X1 [Lates japonicus]|uniref:Zinc finger protein 512B isoform X1 n=1 Tax=Lates japonicus TaxID=270547 RepID=A0AAD3M2T9_LATJO|nr:zinc finger protein 512B isoform X1 [Lates japonicus]
MDIPRSLSEPRQVLKTTTNTVRCVMSQQSGRGKVGPKAEVQELRSIPVHMIVQWKEEFKRRSRVKCPCSGCWLEFPSIYGVKYHYQRCQGGGSLNPLLCLCFYPFTIAEKLVAAVPTVVVICTKVRLQEKHKQTTRTVTVGWMSLGGWAVCSFAFHGRGDGPLSVFFKVKKRPTKCPHALSEQGLA